MDRRSFLRLSAFAVAAGGVSQIIKLSDVSAASGLKKNTLKNIAEEKWIATSCLNCPACCAIRVRRVDGKAVKIAGNPLSAVSEGKVCPRAHIGLQVLYDPERIGFPLKRANRKKGRGALL